MIDTFTSFVVPFEQKLWRESERKKEPDEMQPFFWISNLFFYSLAFWALNLFREQFLVFCFDGLYSILWNKVYIQFSIHIYK